MNALASLFCGVLFGIGLALSGMTDITKVIGFLDITGQWDPSLMFVMGGGLCVTLPFFQLVQNRMSTPKFAETYSIPTKKDIDIPLVSGAVLFGLGWGISGLCPGPALAGLAYLNPDMSLFLVFMVVGLFAGEYLPKIVKRVPESSKIDG